MSVAVAGQELSANVSSFLSASLQKAFVNGRFVEAAGGETFDVVDPGTGEKIATVASLQKSDVDAAVDAADAAFQSGAWSRMPVNERCAVLHRIADAVEQRLAEFAQVESLDCGKVYSQAEGDIQGFIDTFRYFADLAQTVNYRNVIAVKNHEAWVARHPWGPCGAIIPWNFPFLLAGWGLAPALAAGNTCVLKPRRRYASFGPVSVPHDPGTRSVASGNTERRNRPGRNRRSGCCREPQVQTHELHGLPRSRATGGRSLWAQSRSP